MILTAAKHEDLHWCVKLQMAAKRRGEPKTLIPGLITLDVGSSRTQPARNSSPDTHNS
jgi:hypothetical protein